MQERTMQDEVSGVNIAEEQRFYDTLSEMYEALLRTFPIDERGEWNSRAEWKSLKDNVNLMKRQGLDMVHRHMREEERNNRS